jgi:O-succinylbenzoate synthase
MPVVVSSALESSIGLAAGVALAAALPELPYACGLGTGSLLVDDVVAEPLLAVDGHLPVLRSDDPRLTPVRFSSDESLAERWNARIARVGAR